jgi:hypothetical protein
MSMAVAATLWPQPSGTELETPMNVKYLSAALMAAGLLIAAPAFAQTAPVQKQPTQEGGSDFAPLPCALPYNANPAADPDCKQQTQNLARSSLQAAQDASVKSK